MEGYYVKDGKLYLDTHGHAFPAYTQEISHIVLHDCLERPVYDGGAGLNLQATVIATAYILKHFTIKLKDA